LVADDKKQFESAKAFIEDATLTEPLFVPLSVSVELEWILRSLYELDIAMILTAFNRLLETRKIQFQEESSIEITLSLYSDNNADFADCLHIACAHFLGNVCFPYDSWDFATMNNSPIPLPAIICQPTTEGNINYYFCVPNLSDKIRSKFIYAQSCRCA